MSTLKNFVNINKKDDLVPPTFARSVLELARAIKARAANSGLAAAIAAFKGHVNNHDNPHEVSLAQFANNLSGILYTSYLSVISEDPTETLLTQEQFTAWVNNPIVFIELCRRLTLDSYLYDDGVGNVTSPIYGLDDIYPDVPPLQPSYFVGYSMPDRFLANFTSDGSLLARALPLQSSRMTVGISVNPGDSSAKNLAFSVTVANSYSDGFVANITPNTINTSGGYVIQVQALYGGQPPASSIISTGSDFIQEGVLNYWPFTALSTENTVVVVIDGMQLSIYYVIQTLIQKVTVAISDSVYSRAKMDRVIMSPIWNQRNAATAGIENLMVYPEAFTDAEVSTLFERL